MKAEKLSELLKQYADEIRSFGYQPKEYPSYEIPCQNLSRTVHMSHALWMCENALSFIENGERDKADRWLGFIQCIFFMNGFFTVGQMRNHSRS